MKPSAGARHRPADAQLARASGRAGRYAALVDQLAVAHADDLVDAVGELVAAILDMHARRRDDDVAAVDIGITRHDALFRSGRRLGGHVLAARFAGPPPCRPSDFSLRCSAERSMPTKAAVREMLPPKRVTWASRYSRSNTSRASRSGSCMISPPLSQRSTDGAILADVVRQHVGADRLAAVAGARISSRSTTLRSWRTLPGQSWPCSAASASSPIARGRQAGRIGDARACRWSASSGMSSRRSRERRHAQRHDVQAMEQILAEAAGGDLLLQVARRSRRARGHRPRPASCRRRARRTAPAARAPSLLCSRERQVGDFFEQQRAAMRQLEGARDLRSVAVGRRCRCRTARSPAARPAWSSS